MYGEYYPKILGTDTGAVRAYFLYKGMHFQFGSLEESIAMTVHGRERNIQYLAPLFAIAGPDDRSSLINSYRGAVFPEDKYYAHKYIQKAKETFERLRGVTFEIQTSGGSSKKGWERKTK